MKKNQLINKAMENKLLMIKLVKCINQIMIYSASKRWNNTMEYLINMYNEDVKIKKRFIKNIE